MGKVLGQSRFGPITEPESPIPVFGQAPTSPTYRTVEGSLGSFGEPREVTKPYQTYTEIPKLGDYTYTPTQERSLEEYRKAYQLPSSPTFGSYQATPMNRSTISRYTQENASNPTSKLSRGLFNTINQTRAAYDNPYMMKQGIKSGLEGFGAGLGDVYAGARKAAMNEYLPEYSAQVDADKAAWEATTKGKLAQYADELDKAKTLFGLTAGSENEMRKMIFDAFLKDRLANT